MNYSTIPFASYVIISIYFIIKVYYIDIVINAAVDIQQIIAAPSTVTLPQQMHPRPCHKNGKTIRDDCTKGVSDENLVKAHFIF